MDALMVMLHAKRDDSNHYKNKFILESPFEIVVEVKWCIL